MSSEGLSSEVVVPTLQCCAATRLPGPAFISRPGALLVAGCSPTWLSYTAAHQRIWKHTSAMCPGPEPEGKLGLWGHQVNLGALLGHPRDLVIFWAGGTGALEAPYRPACGSHSSAGL